MNTFNHNTQLTRLGIEIAAKERRARGEPNPLIVMGLRTELAELYTQREALIGLPQRIAREQVRAHDEAEHDLDPYDMRDVNDVERSQWR